MTSKEKKRILLRYGEIGRHIDELEAEKSFWWSRVTSTIPVMSDLPKGGGSDGTLLEVSVENIMKIEQQINDEIDRLATLRDKISSAIQSMTDEREKRVLYLAYIGKSSASSQKRLKLHQIAREMNYSEIQIKRIHGHALLHINLET